jgi:hypothetical protein
MRGGVWVDIVVVRVSVLVDKLGVVKCSCEYCRSRKVMFWSEELYDEAEALYLPT